MDEVTTIDLFAGAGGLTEGFAQAGARCVFANDLKETAVETFAHNHPGTEVVAGSIYDLNPKVIRKGLAIRKGELDVLTGGPPCQGFSINAPKREESDPRNSLFRQYLKFVDEFAPKFFVMENVPGMISLGGGRIFETILQEFGNRGYRTQANVLLAANFGVPQVRWRTIIIGTRLNCREEFHPPMTHYYEARPNFSGGKTMALRPLPLDQFHMEKAVTIADAIADLPPIPIGGGEEVASYKVRAKSPLARQLRGKQKSLYNHTANRLSKINLSRLAHIQPGEAWPAIPFDLLPAGMQKAKRSDHTKRYGRLPWEALAGTVMTKCDPHWGAVFHPEQDRTYSVRELARFQTFPDAYRFLGPRVAQFEQVGNAVPVFLGRAIALHLRKLLDKFSQKDVACR